MHALNDDVLADALALGLFWPTAAPPPLLFDPHAVAASATIANAARAL